ncbi:helix-turn-helix domain-containing protein [Kitasatospora sp. NPDC059571]|uniref:helix-turn-helix domain-containing protein n=1 Tax=Kitasatospora sp. NPDC059571 TaxID=3346871 RepID=UPI0036CE776F
MSLHRVVALVNAPQSTFELACAAEVFGTQRPEVPARYDFRVCAQRPGPVATTAGYAMIADHGLEALGQADTVVLPGWEPMTQAPAAPVLESLRAAHRRGARIVSLCTGAFALAHTGLLDGRRATTHWRRTGLLATAFPAVHVEADVLYEDLGDVATSAGTGAAIDLCLHLVRSDHGAAYAARVARGMVLAPHREGGQLQYAVQPAPRRADDSLAPLLDWAAERLHSDLTVEQLAARVGVSGRTLARRFAEQLGTSPGRWLLARRLDAARTLLEETRLPVESVAVLTGLSSAVNLRRRFRAALGTTPGHYRQTFNPSGPGRRAESGPSRQSAAPGATAQPAP